jgi:hypothetical protein
MDKSKIKLIAKVARFYYEEGENPKEAKDLKN